MKIALAGNPNSGKTTMYNALTGSSEKVGNWAGVTVDKKESPIKRSLCQGEEIMAVDLPGAYSMSPFTTEESVTRDYIKNENPDVIINIVDATNLSRSLFFTTQLLELGIPTVVALNKADINKKKETRIDSSLLSQLLGCPVVDTISTSSQGLEDVVRSATDRVGRKQEAPFSQGKIDLSDKTAVERADRTRFNFVKEIVAKVETRKVFAKERNGQDKADEILTNKWFGIPIFAAIMCAVLWISQFGPGVWLADLIVGWLESGQEALAEALGDGIWASILVDGIIGGVIAVIGFLPLVMVMYFLIALLEDCGYMSRVSVVLDPIFKRVGLSGKSIIPFIIGTGCAIPGVMASRTIRDERERRATAMLAPFMPCGAKLPVISLFAGAFFGNGAWWVSPLMYFMGIAIIFVGALLVNLITGKRHKRSYFIMELPEYKAPSILGACKAMLQRGWAYIVKAGTVILICNFVVHLMQNFTWSFSPVGEDASESILATVATPFGYLFAPVIGYFSWQMAAATITGFIAKENVVGTLAVCYGLTNLINPDELVLVEGANVSEVALAFGNGTPMFAGAALAYLMFNLFTPPCFAAIGAMNSEIKSKRWLFAGIGLQLGMGFTVGFLVNFFATVFSDAQFASLWMPVLGWVIVGVFASVLAGLIVRRQGVLKKEEAQKRSAKATEKGFRVV